MGHLKRDVLSNEQLKQTAMDILHSDKYSKVKGSECAESLNRCSVMKRKRIKKGIALEDNIRDLLKIKAA